MSEKKYTVYYSPVAKDDLKSVYTYIAYTLLEKKIAADQTDRIRKEIRSLNVFPERYRLVDWEPWNQMGIRQVPIGNYVVYYRVDHEGRRVEIVRIFYGGQDVEAIIQSQQQKADIPNIVQSLVGAIPQTDLTLTELRDERLEK